MVHTKLKDSSLGLLSKAQKIHDGDGIILLMLVVFTLVFRFITLMIMNTGIDERDYWLAAKSISQGLPFPVVNHRTVRWAVVLPTAISQMLFGTHPNVYYVVPVFFQVLQTVFLYKIGSKMFNSLTGVLTAVAMVVFPYSARVGSQIRPEVVAIVFILGAFWYLLRFLEQDDREIKLYKLLPVVLFLYLGYHAKITNLFFFPGMVGLVWFRFKKLKPVIFFMGTLFGLYVLETFAYGLFSSYPLGHLQIISQHHLSDSTDYAYTGFLALFKRYMSPHLQWYWQIPMALFAVLSFLSLLFPKWFLSRLSKEQLAGYKTAVLLSYSFFFFITFSFRSLDPLLLLESFINRYFYAVMGFVFLVISISFVHILGFIISKLPSNKIETLFSKLLEKPRSFTFVLILSLSLGIFGSLFFPFGQRFGRFFAWNPRDISTHSLWVTDSYYRLLNNPELEQVPIMANTGNGGMNSLQTVNGFFRNEALEIAGISINGQEYLGMNLESVPNSSLFFVVNRGPFVVFEATKEDLPRLALDRFVRFGEFE